MKKLNIIIAISLVLSATIASAAITLQQKRELSNLKAQVRKIGPADDLKPAVRRIGPASTNTKNSAPKNETKKQETKKTTPKTVKQETGANQKPSIRKIGSVIATVAEPVHNQGINVSQEEVGAISSGQVMDNTVPPPPANISSGVISEQMAALSETTSNQQASNQTNAENTQPELSGDEGYLQDTTNTQQETEQSELSGDEKYLSTTNSHAENNNTDDTASNNSNSFTKNTELSKSETEKLEKYFTDYEKNK